MMRKLLKKLVVLLWALALGFAVGTFVSRRKASEASSSQILLPTAFSTEGNSLPLVQDTGYTVWNEAESPNYYRVVGPAVVGQWPQAGTVVYGPLDELGRATGAVAHVTYDSMTAGRARDRESLADVTPTGWGHNQEVDIAMPDGNIYHGQLFNRSHLVAKSLGGDDEAHNLITATRTQNVGANVVGYDGGMAYGEGLARDWLERHREGTVYYSAVPVFEGDELVARSVLVDLRSSDGSLDQRIEVYNAAKGFDIDYAAGSFSTTGGDAVSDEAKEAETNVDANERMVVVTGSGKAYHHDESCKGLTEARSMEWVTLSEAEAMGRHPCGICGG
ncbi:MAG: DNA/RNA non-specific endonuclease [Atopobiaceae bacterium]|nr:DNA/RNA non-specific endonuclease [Atopobiaceae bacterium]